MCINSGERVKCFIHLAKFEHKLYFICLIEAAVTASVVLFQFLVLRDFTWFSRFPTDPKRESGKPTQIRKNRENPDKIGILGQLDNHMQKARWAQHCGWLLIVWGFSVVVQHQE